ncbi:MAG: GNAT family N-acetyltransferase [Rhodospirillales bacterium]|nr:GNAT family N-acetyltransferase [Rhodospirillales bacterium]
MNSETGCLSAGRGWRGEPLTTQELRLRPPQEDDAARIAAIANDDEIASWTAELPHPYGLDDAKDFIAKAARDRQDGTSFVFVVERLADGLLVGVIHLAIEERTGRLGYWIGRQFWKQGYASQAVLRLTRLGFQSLHLDGMNAQVMSGNQASCRVLEKAGYLGAPIASCQLAGRCKDVPVTLYRIESAVWRMLQAVKPTLLVVAAAILDTDNRVLLARRPRGKAMAGLWEFPGGKIKAGESPEAALLRELKEELGIDAYESCLAPLAFASHDYDSFHLLMPLFVLRQWQGTPHAHEGQQLAWVGKERLNDYPMPPADLPLVPILREWL